MHVLYDCRSMFCMLYARWRVIKSFEVISLSLNIIKIKIAGAKKTEIALENYYLHLTVDYFKKL